MARMVRGRQGLGPHLVQTHAHAAVGKLACALATG